MQLQQMALFHFAKGIEKQICDLPQRTEKDVYEL